LEAKRSQGAGVTLGNDRIVRLLILVKDKNAAVRRDGSFSYSVGDRNWKVSGDSHLQPMAVNWFKIECIAQRQSFSISRLQFPLTVP